MRSRFFTNDLYNRALVAARRWQQLIDHLQFSATGDVLPVRLATLAFRDALRADSGKMAQFNHKFYRVVFRRTEVVICFIGQAFTVREENRDLFFGGNFGAFS